jgi:hypothetical protein
LCALQTEPPILTAAHSAQERPKNFFTSAALF